MGNENPAIPYCTSLAHAYFDFDMFLTNTWFHEGMSVIQNRSLVWGVVCSPCL